MKDSGRANHSIDQVGYDAFNGLFYRSVTDSVIYLFA